MISFDGQHALVTGGTRGIGLAIATRLTGLGAKVIVTGRSAEAPDAASSFDYIQANFASEEGTNAFAARLRGLTDLSVLVNNAGLNKINRIEDYPPEEFDELTQINYTSVYRLSQAAAQVMLENKTKGRIVNIASIWATNTKVGRSAYCAAKAGVLGMTRAVAVDLAAQGIIVNAVSPGFTNTELTAQTLGAEGIAEVSALIPAGRMAEPAEIAEAVAFLASPNNTYIVGQNLVVDGGFTHV